MNALQTFLIEQGYSVAMPRNRNFSICTQSGPVLRAVFLKAWLHGLVWLTVWRYAVGSAKQNTGVLLLFLVESGPLSIEEGLLFRACLCRQVLKQGALKPILCL